uniref:WD repeat-containing protein 66 n=1 Tax=Anas zonorhyncha TaxID=75864 RepID=A0A8B9UVA4_9AVES
MLSAFRKTLLGPTYGSPLEKIQILPTRSTTNPQKCYLAYITKDKVGLQILPVDGNPHKSSAFICHPDGVSDLACSYDGRYIFTAGGNDRTVLKWEVNLNALEAAASLGGEDLVPFYSLLEGGREGEFFRELEDYFYYVQLRSQGIDALETRQVSTHIPLEEIPSVMRAMGFYPSEEEIEEMINEVKFSEYVDTGEQVTKINLGDFIKLYINHRPAFGLSMKAIRRAFQVLGYDNENGDKVIDRGDLLLLLQCRGDHELGTSTMFALSQDIRIKLSCTILFLLCAEMATALGTGLPGLWSVLGRGFSGNSSSGSCKCNIALRAVCIRPSPFDRHFCPKCMQDRGTVFLGINIFLCWDHVL